MAEIVASYDMREKEKSESIFAIETNIENRGVVDICEKISNILSNFL